MDKRILRLGFQLLLGVILVFCIHQGVLTLLQSSDLFSGMGVNLIYIYGFEFIITIIIFVVLIGIDYAMPQNLGFVFLGAIAFRGVASYLFLGTILHLDSNEDFIKYNFLVSFMVFLALDAFMAYQILNKKIS